MAFGIWHLTFDKYLTLFARLNKPAFVDFAAAKGYESRRGVWRVKGHGESFWVETGTPMIDCTLKPKSITSFPFYT